MKYDAGNTNVKYRMGDKNRIGKRANLNNISKVPMYKLSINDESVLEASYQKISMKIIIKENNPLIIVEISVYLRNCIRIMIVVINCGKDSNHASNANWLKNKKNPLASFQNILLSSI